MVILVFVSLLAVHLVIVSVNGDCRIFDESRITCECDGDEEFLLPEGNNYENVTIFELASCSSAYLHFSTLTEASQIEELIVQNISGTLKFELFLTASRMKTFRLLNIGRIPTITHETFLSLKRIEHFEVENTEIEDFNEQFDEISITEFIMKNVTIKRIEGINLSEKGSYLRIADSLFQMVVTSLKFAHFQKVKIINCQFDMPNPGQILIETDVAVLQNNVFSNVSINVVASKAIRMTSSCADGRSSLRLSAKSIESSENRLPTEIVYTGVQPIDQTAYFINHNNTVCRAGNCNCPKSSSQPSKAFLLGRDLYAHLLMLATITFLF